MMDITYFDTATFYKVSKGGYGNHLITGSDDVACLFLQNKGFNHTSNQDFINADAICYPDPESDFLINNNYNLQGMYFLAPNCLSTSDNWYLITSVTINRDILIENQIGNIELTLKKTAKIDLVS